MISKLRNLIISEKQNPDLQSTIDIPMLLLAAENVDMDDLGNRTLSDISREIVQALQNINLPAEKISEICGKLAEYRLTDQVYQIQKGKHVRWIRAGGCRPPATPCSTTSLDLVGGRRGATAPCSTTSLDLVGGRRGAVAPCSTTSLDLVGGRRGATAPCSLTNGGIVVDVKFLDNGTHILCKNGLRFIQYKFDDCLTFQKLSADEQMVLSCYDFLRK